MNVNFKITKNYLSVVFYLSGIFAILSASRAMAAESIETTAMKILSESPEFISQTYSLESALTESKTASNLTDPEIGGEYLVAPKDADNRWAAELSWSMEWPGVYSARGREAAMQMTAMEKKVWYDRNERLAEIRDLLIDYVACQFKKALLEELTQNNDTIYRLAEQAAKGGELTVLDLNKVKLEYANIRVARAALMDEIAEINSSLALIYGSDCTPILENMECRFPETNLPSLEELAYIKENSPVILSAMAEVGASREAKNIAKMETLPSLSVGYKHAFEDATHFNGVTLGISLPIFSSRGKKKAANARLKESEFKVEARQAELEANIDAIIKKLDLTIRQIEELTPIIENVDYNTTLLKAYKGGVITLIEYITDRNYFTNAAIELVALRHSAAKTSSRLRKYL